MQSLDSSAAKCRPPSIDSAVVNRVFMIVLQYESCCERYRCKEFLFLEIVAAQLGDTKRLILDQLIRANRAGLHPGVKERAGSRLRAGRGPTISSRSPGPAD